MNYYIGTRSLNIVIAVIHISLISANRGDFNVIDSKLILNFIDRVDQLEAREGVYIHEIENLRDTVKRLADRVAELEGGRDEYERDKDVTILGKIETTQQNYAENESKKVRNSIRATKRRNGFYLSDINAYTMLHSKEEPTLRQIRQDEIDNVAFYAVVDTHHLENLGANQRLEFDRIVTNIGNGYRSGLGVFITPVGGTYVFTTTLMGINHDNNHYYIAVNGNAVANMYIHGQDSYLNSATRTVVLQLKPGDEVSVNNMNVTEGVFGYQFSSFAGFLLYPDVSAKYVVG